MSAFTRPGIVTQARTTSTRLPGKVLARVGGRTLLDHHLDRLSECDVPVTVATTVNAADDPIAVLCERRGVPVFRGAEHDVLGRYHGAARARDLDVVVRVTSDCPLIDGRLVTQAVAQFLEERDPWLYLSNTQVRTYPRGFDVEVFSAVALADAYRHAAEPFEREHVTPYLARNESGRMRIAQLTSPDDTSWLRVTVDDRDDLELVRALIEEHDADSKGWEAIVHILRDHPELVALNSHVRQKQLGE